MTYVKSDDGVSAAPYTLMQLKEDNPQTMLPLKPDDVFLAKYNIYPLIENPDPPYDPATEKLEEGTITGSGTSWSITRVVVPMTQEELDAYSANQDREADIAAMKADPEVLTLLKARPSQINTYIENNVTDLDSAKTILKIYGRALAVLAYTIIN